MRSSMPARLERMIGAYVQESRTTSGRPDGEQPSPRDPRRTRVALALLVAGAAWAWAMASHSGRWDAYLAQLLLLLGTGYIIAVGADWLVDSSCNIAQRFGVSYLAIGLTVVAFGTSAPEVAASLLAGFRGNGDLSIANVIGSNIFNLCFILGGVAVLVKGGLRADRALVTRDGPMLLGGTLLLGLFVGRVPWAQADPEVSGGAWKAFNLRLEPLEGAILFGCLLLYLGFLYRMLRAKGAAEHSGTQDAGTPASELPFEAAERRIPPATPLLLEAFFLIAGLVLVVGGCHLLVGHAEGPSHSVRGFGALWFARVLDVPDYVVGVTIVAAGTSAPEFVVSLVAAMRGAFGLSAGNLIGSDIFNVFGVVGLAGLLLQEPLAPPVTLSPAVMPSLLALSLLVALTLVFMWTGRRVSRTEGLILVAIGLVRWAMDFVFRGQL